MTIKICASITAKTFHEIERMIKISENSGADLIEIRLDYLEEKYSLKEIRTLSSIPFIATNRSLYECGFFKGAEEERTQTLILAASFGFDYIDIELSTENSQELINKVNEIGAKTIISSHIFDSTPDIQSLNAIFKKELKYQADICKIVTFAKEFKDNLNSLKFLEKAANKSEITCFCMGELGIISRLLSPLFGGYFTYAAVMKGKEAATGQITVAEMRQFYSILGV